VRAHPDGLSVAFKSQARLVSMSTQATMKKTILPLIILLNTDSKHGEMGLK